MATWSLCGGHAGPDKRLPVSVGVEHLATKSEEDEQLNGPRGALDLDPASARALRRDQRAVPH
jgi:hypothetical protein